MNPPAKIKFTVQVHSCSCTQGRLHFLLLLATDSIQGQRFIEYIEKYLQNNVTLFCKTILHSMFVGFSEQWNSQTLISYITECWHKSATQTEAINLTINKGSGNQSHLKSAMRDCFLISLDFTIRLIISIINLSGWQTMCNGTLGTR